MLTKRIVPSLLQDVIYFLRFCPKNLLQRSIPSPTTADLTLSGLAEEGFDPARSGARDPQGQQIGSRTPAALVPEYWQVRLATVLPSELCPTSFLPLSLFLCSFSHGKSSAAPFSWVGNFFFLNSVQSSHAAEIFFHAGCDIALYGDLSFPVTPESVGNDYSIYSNILRKHMIITNLTWLPEASSSNFQSN